MKRSFNALLVLGFVAVFARVGGGCVVVARRGHAGYGYGGGYSYPSYGYGQQYVRPAYGSGYGQQQPQYVVTGGTPGVPGQPVVIQPNVSGPVTVSGPNGPTTYMGGIQVVRPPVNQGPYYVAPGQVPGYWKGTRPTPKEAHN